MILDPNNFRFHIEAFNNSDDELYQQAIPNAETWPFLQDNIPFFECPDREFEEIYYFRWWTYRKHIRETPDGFVITEFLPDVKWAGKHNTIACPAALHLYEGRWLKEQRYLDDYTIFWFRKGGNPRLYSFWAADAIWKRHLVQPNPELLSALLPDLVQNYREWEKSKLCRDGLFRQSCDRDGMEFQISGNGKRVTINAYMYGDALAIANIAGLAGRQVIADEFTDKAGQLKELIQSRLWDKGADFFKTVKRWSNRQVNVRELAGYLPWYFDLPDQGYEKAWAQLMDSAGFYAPFGPTSAEQRHPRFSISYKHLHECLWNGPSWPFATSQTLTALANLINNYDQNIISKADYFDILTKYTTSQRRKLDDGHIVPWIDEDLDPYTGTWIARQVLQRRGKKPLERGKDYNHSTYCDLIISGLVGLRPADGNIIEINPLLPEETWDWFCLDNISYHGKILSIIWDKHGDKYMCGKGLQILCDGELLASSPTLARLSCDINM